MPSPPFRSVLWNRLDARGGGVSVLRLELHRHLPETASLGEHAHRHWQALVYLSGHGTQQIRRARHAVATGSLVIIPPGVPHSFRRRDRLAPLCLMIDFGAPWPERTAVRQLAAIELAKIRSLLASIARVADDSNIPDNIERAGMALAILAAVTGLSGWHPRPHRRSARTILHQVQKRLEKDPLTPPKRIAADLDYHPDHLSRLVRQETGLSLHGLATQIRLQRAQRLLRDKRLVRDAAEAAGFHDQNYFARWFRKQTGLAPTAWRA